MIELINHHPTLLYSQDIIDICRPLQHLNITYFAHVRIDKDKKFSAISNNPYFMEHYLSNAYYNVDIHMADKNILNNFIVWDSVKRTSLSAKMHAEAAHFGVRHTFTIIEENSQESNYYHFANHLASKNINYTYLANLDLLQLFIAHFKERISLSPSLSKAYQLIFDIDPNAEGYQLAPSYKKKHHNMRSLVMQQMRKSSPFSLLKMENTLSKRELDCLFLTIRGKTAKQIAKLLNISFRTVEEYLMNIKYKMCVTSKSELIEKSFYLMNNFNIF